MTEFSEWLSEEFDKSIPISDDVKRALDALFRIGHTEPADDYEYGLMLSRIALSLEYDYHDIIHTTVCNCPFCVSFMTRAKTNDDDIEDVRVRYNIETVMQLKNICDAIIKSTQVSKQ